MSKEGRVTRTGDRNRYGVLAATLHRVSALATLFLTNAAGPERITDFPPGVR